ncbi:MAG: N-acetyltransferase [Planctomycetes bacterium]|nr:N-acetyltransferase [Planctomycetota bacterium]MCC8115560.1 N-acetyltransferase [Planctomycetota bacterium]MCD7897973.1 N-acetyltransferase [Planctomycetaceae bacterium]
MTAAASLTIRPERKDEFPVIYDLIRGAFATARVADGDEQDYMNSLRESENYIPELALVLEVDGRLVGHIALTRVPLRTDDGRAVRSLLLAPLSIAPAEQSKGYGDILTRDALRRAGLAGWQAVFLAGSPDYYGRFGFRAAGEFDIVFTGNVPPEFVLALELEKGALTPGEVDITPPEAAG